MEQWEIDLRKKLNEELPEGRYRFHTSNLTVFTGKQGQIDFMVEVARSRDELRGGEGLLSQIRKSKETIYKGNITYEMIDKFLNKME